MTFDTSRRTGSHTAAVRAGWNDAAWGMPRRLVAPPLIAAYERGYQGGLRFRASRRLPVADATLATPPPRLAMSA